MHAKRSARATTTDLSREPIDQLGSHGSRVNIYRVVLLGEPVVRVEWREEIPGTLGADGKPLKRRRTEPFRGPKRDAERQARAFAEGVAQRLRSNEIVAPTARLTIGQLGDAYFLAHAPDWREKTRVLNLARWKVFTQFISPNVYADLVTPETLDEWRAQLLTLKRRTGHPMVRNQVAHHIQQVKSVWKFGRARKLLKENLIVDYAVRRGRDYQALQVDEFSPEEFAQILAQLSYRQTLRWRAWALIAGDGILGPRAKALLRLRWTDIDEKLRHVTWPATSDKVGKVRVQPFPRDVMLILRVAKVWRARDGYTGPWVFYGADQRTRKDDRPYSYAALVQALHRACRRAGVPVKKWRGMHGLRRMSGKTVLEMTGDLNKAGVWLGDSDPRTLKRSYLRGRPKDLDVVVAGLALPRGVEQVPAKPSPATKRRRKPDAGVHDPRSNGNEMETAPQPRTPITTEDYI